MFDELSFRFVFLGVGLKFQPIKARKQCYLASYWLEFGSLLQKSVVLNIISSLT